MSVWKKSMILLQNPSLSFTLTSTKPFHFPTLSWFWSAENEAVQHQLFQGIYLNQKLSDAYEASKTPLFLI